MAIVDIGSNTAKLIALAYRPGVAYRHLDQLRQVVRLSAGMGESGILRGDAVERGLAAVATFASYCRATGIDEVYATATSAVRDASNGDSFVAAARERSGIELVTLSGEAEAAAGVRAVANSHDVDEALVLDLGGGSIQLSHMKGRRFVRGRDWPLGALRSTERFLTSDPPDEDEIDELRSAARESLAPWLETIPAGLPVIGMGGTIRNLANAQQKRDDYPVDLLHGYRFRTDDLADLTDDLEEMSAEERGDVSGINRDRGDIILAGAVVILEALRLYEAPEATICGQGLREGVFYPYLFPEGDHLAPDVREFAVRNLMRDYYDHPAHNDHVRELALQLFDQLEPWHGYGAAERELLAAAALVHDIGMAIDYYSHHKHALYLAMGRPLPGFSHREQVLIALLCRYHRKGSPSAKGYDDALGDGDLELLARLAGILRVAEYLERSKAQKVARVRCHLGDGYLQIEAFTRGDARVEILEAGERSELLADAFGVQVEVTEGYA